jgi:hypothetical protein
MLCRGSHQTHLFPRMDEASKLLEDMTISKPQLPIAYHKLTLDPHVVDGMINMTPSSVNLVDHVVNLVTSLFDPVDKVVDPMPLSADPTLPLESVTQAVDPFLVVNPILLLESETQVVDLISSVNPTLPLESKPDTSNVFLVDTEFTVLGGIPPSPAKPPPSNEAILFNWDVLTRTRLPSHIPFKITIQVCGRDVPQMLIDEGSSVSILSSIAWQYLGYPQLALVT